MGFRKSRSSVKDSLATATVLQKSVEKSLALESENSKLRHHVSVLSRRLHEVIAKLKAQSKTTIERVVEEERRLEKVEFAGGMDIEPLVIEEEVAVEEEQKIVVRLLVAVAESVAGAEVVEDVTMVEVAGKGKEMAVVADEAEGGVGSREEDWMVVRKRVRVSGEEKRSKALEEERDAVRKRMNFWRPAKVVVPNAPLRPRGMRGWSRSDSSYGSPGPSGFKNIVGGERVESVGEGIVPRAPLGTPTGSRAYGDVALSGEKRLSFKRLGSVPEGRKMYGLDSGRGLVVYGGVRDWQGLGRNGHRGLGWYCRNPDGYLT
ncbi:hypothetical protein HOY80DRAFT_1046229 [Tuber brumale]|nr:hypothetical protein HOY80DRAFT_1046229 [Tuber brumale]